MKAWQVVGLMAAVLAVKGASSSSSGWIMGLLGLHDVFSWRGGPAPDDTASTPLVAHLESAIGLAILVLLFRNRSSVNVDELNVLKG